MLRNEGGGMAKTHLGTEVARRVDEVAALQAENELARLGLQALERRGCAIVGGARLRAGS
jgi:hypothetical protein